METYLDYKNSIQGLEDVSETVKATEKIAASSIHSLKLEVSALKEYEANINKVLARLQLFYSGNEHPFLSKNKGGENALVMIGGAKGLVGGLWHGMVNAFLEKTYDYGAVVVVGEKLKNYLEEEKAHIVRSFFGDSDSAEEEEVSVIRDYVFNEFNKGTFSRIDILYPQFNSLAEQTPAFIPFLPFEFSPPDTSAASAEGLPIFDPSKKRIFGELLEKYIGLYLYKVILEAKLSEFSARTVSMENAEAKTKELMRKFTSLYRKEHRLVFSQRQLEVFAAHKII